MEGHHRTTMAVYAGDRFPQWSVQETRDLLAARSELDQTFLETKRNKVLWEVVARKMREKGYNRSAEQCKSKWKNLVTRYKGCGTMELEGIHQPFPFYNELEAIFVARMERMLWLEAEGGSLSGTKNKGVALASDDEDDNEESDREKAGSRKKKEKVHKSGNSPNSGGNISVLKETLEEFMKQQMQIEMDWLKAYKAKEEERRVREMEWRQTMESLESERIVMERRWREREEQRRMREEARAENRDALISALLNKLGREDMQCAL